MHIVFVALLIFSTIFAYEPLISLDDTFKDFGDEEHFSPDLVEISLEDFTLVKGIRHKTCEANREKCKEFIKCTTSCDSFWIDISSLSDATFTRRDDKTKGKTNPCVAMYVYCLPAPYAAVREALDLSSPKDF